MKISHLLSATALVSCGLLAPSFAYAAGKSADKPVTAADATPAAAAPAAAPQGTPQAADEAPTKEVVVTGSRITRPNLESTVPISSIAGEQFFKEGESNIGEALNDLPQLRSTFSQQNPGLGIGIAGLNLLDLRGLGTVRTLVLVNGRRHVAADILNNAVSPDVNSIPADLIERVDIVTGGNSAVYGSDAIAGVVNFVLKRSYDGLQLRGTASISPEGFGGNQYLSAMFGKNFAGGRGNITLHGEFSNQARYFGSDLPWLRSVDTFGAVDSDPAGLPNGSDGFPDAVFIRDIRLASINRFGLVPITEPGVGGAGGAPCGTGVGATNGGPSSTGTNAAGALTPGNNGVPYNCTYLFDASNALNAQTGSRYGAGIIGGIAGGNGQTGREDRLLSIQPSVRRYNFNLLAHYEFTPAFEAFLEAKWTRVDVVGNNASPTGIQGTFSTFDFRERTRLDNPFLTAAQRTQLSNLILASGCNTSLSAACVNPNGTPTTRSTTAGQGTGGPLNAADIAAINAGTYRFVVARTLADVGIRDEVFRRDTYRFVGGFRGTFNDDWKYEISLNYGKFNQTVDTNGFVDRQRFMLALDAGRNPVTGQIQCRSQFDPASAAAYDTGAYQTGTSGSRSNAGQAARLAADIAACVPYNPFGAGNNTASANYFTRHAHTTASLSQFVANAFVSGDTGGFLNLPGGPVRFALGGEYRAEDGTYFDDPFLLEGNPSLAVPTQSNTNSVVIGNFNPPAFKVKEAFAEIQIPLLKDMPFFEELTFSGAGRVSSYGGGAKATGTVWAYNAGVDWAPIRDIRFRANYSRSVRAPNLSELYFPPVANFAPGFVDPCSPGSIASGTSFRPANCLAAVGGNAAVLAAIPNATQSLAVINGSNPNLTAEKSDSYTFGAVIQPRFIPGLSLSVDYYNIKVKNVIVALGAQSIVNNCVDQASLNNQFCALFSRYLGPTPGPLSEITGQVAGNTLLQAGVNFASRQRRGIDVNLAYRANLGSGIKLDSSLIYTHNLMISDYLNPAVPNFENRILSELGDPQDEFRWDTDLAVGAVTFGYSLRYVGPMFTSSYENFNPLATACPQLTPCTAAQLPPLNSDAIEIRELPAVFYHNVRVEFNLPGNKFQFYVGVDNVLDTHPPFGATGTGSLTADRGGGQAAIYDAFGRKFYTGFRARF